MSYVGVSLSVVCSLAPLTMLVQAMPMRRIRSLIQLVLGVVGCLGLMMPVEGWAQTEPLTFRSLSTRDGLSEDAVKVILQDQDGYMWFGTENGLNRYDGYTFSLYTRDRHDTTSLSHPHITALYESSDETLWVGTVDGLNRYEPLTNRFTRYLLSTDVALQSMRLEQRSTNIRSISESPEGYLLVHAGEALFRFDPQTGHVLNVLFSPEDSTAASVTTTLFDTAGTLWIGTTAGLYEASLTQQATDMVAVVDARHFPDQSIVSLTQDASSTMWVGTHAQPSVQPTTSQLFQRRAADAAFTPYRLFLDVGDPTTELPTADIWTLVSAPDGVVWMGTLGKGLYRHDPRIGTTSVYTQESGDAEGLCGNRIPALYQDRTGTLWIGCYPGGLSIFTPSARHVLHYRHLPGTSNSLAGDRVRAVLEDPHGNLWVGTASAGLSRRDAETGRWTHYNRSNAARHGLDSDAIFALYRDRQGVLWAGGHRDQRGLYRHDVATDRFTLLTDPRGEDFNEVLSLLEDRTGRLWVGTEAGLSWVDQGAGRLVSVAEQTLGVFPIKAILEDKRGVLWLASYGKGLGRFDPRTNTFTAYQTDLNDSTALADDILFALHEGQDGRIWIGTYATGLASLNPETGHFTYLTRQDELPGNTVYSIVPDALGNLWLGMQNGLVRYTPATGAIETFRASDGLGGNAFNPGATFRTPDDRLYFGGTHGLNAFNPQQWQGNPTAPIVHIETLETPQRMLDPGRDGTRLALAYDETVLTFRFTALHYQAPEANRYAYRLEGFDETWTEGGTQRVARYLSVPPGTYTFHVRAASSDGVWNDEGASLQVHIPSPPWLSWWAYTLYTFAVLSLVFGGLWLYVGRQKQRHWVEHANRLAALDEAKNRFFTNISHEFRTPLTLIIGPLEDLLADPKLAEPTAQQLKPALRNAKRLLQLIHQLLDVSKLEAGKLTLQAREVDMNRFLHHLTQAFAPLAERQHIDFAADLPSESVLLYVDPDHFEKIVVNLIANAFKFTPAEGRIRLTLRIEDAHALITVQDNGAGIASEKLPFVFERFYQVDEPSIALHSGTGIGLALTKELTVLHGGTIDATSSVGFGSTFAVRLPLGRAHLTPEQIAASPTAPSRQDLDVALLSEGDGASEVLVPSLGSNQTTVLIVDDNADVRAYVKRHLLPRYRVLEATNGAEALTLAREVLPDLIVSDVMMPEMDGYALCQALKHDDELDYVPVILLTARAEQEDKLQGLAEGADDYLTKPFSGRELAARVDNLITSRHRLRLRFSLTATPTQTPPTQPVANTNEVFLAQVQTAIEEHLGDEHFSVERLAEAVHMSRVHLFRRLRALRDCTPTEWIWEIRLARAQQLLDGNAGSVSEVAYAVGFKSVSHFSKRFRNQFGLSPSAYRKQHLVNVGNTLQPKIDLESEE